MSAPPLLQVSGLSRNFGSLVALDGLDLRVEPGRLVGLVGPDGAGKTTCLRCLAGVLRPDAGQGEILGLPLPGNMEAAKSRLGYMPQRFGLYSDLTVRENLEFYAQIHGLDRRESRQRTMDLLDFVGLGSFLERPAGRLSGGMKQKLGLACALIHRPPLLLLDEPTNGVDPVSRREFWALLTDMLAEGMGALVATTYLDEAERCHSVVLLNKGRFLTAAEPQALRESLKGRLVEITLPDQARAQEILRDLPGLVSVHRFGSSLHVLLGPEAGPEQLETALGAAGLEVERLETIPPSLEDAYIAQLGGNSGDAWL